MKFVLCIFLLLTVYACSVKDAHVPNKEFVHVITDNITTKDSLIFKRFQKKHLIKVKISVLPFDTICQRIQRQKFNFNGDLIICSTFERMQYLKKQKSLLQFESDSIKNRVDRQYRSRNLEWVALSKSPLVVVYNSTFFKRDTLKNYYDLIDSKWQGKQVLYSKIHPTRQSFERNIRLLLKSKSKSFLEKWNAQSMNQIPTTSLYFQQLVQGKALFGVCRLSDFIQFSMKQKRKTALDVMFPNQRKKGCYLDVTSAGIYRYAKNSLQARTLMEYLTSTSAQFSFADGRNEYPVVQGVSVSYRLKKYEQFRARFYRRRNS